jgi:hypothetical protein
MWQETVNLTHVALAVLGAVGVTLLLGWYLGPSFLRRLIAFGAGFVFLFGLYALGVAAAGYAMGAIAAIAVLFAVANAM